MSNFDTKSTINIGKTPKGMVPFSRMCTRRDQQTPPPLKEFESSQRELAVTRLSASSLWGYSTLELRGTRSPSDQRVRPPTFKVLTGMKKHVRIFFGAFARVPSQSLWACYRKNGNQLCSGSGKSPCPPPEKGLFPKQFQRIFSGSSQEFLV